MTALSSRRDPRVSLALRWGTSRSSLRESLWAAPAGAVVLGLLGGGLTARLITPDWLEPITFSGDAGAGRDVVSTLLAALITAVSVVFSLTLVAIQTAGTNYSPRLLRNYIRDRGTQVVLAALLGTISFVLAVLLRMAPDDEGTPQIAVTLALLLALFSVTAIAWFVNHIAQAVRVESVLRAIGRETSETIDSALRDRRRPRDEPADEAALPEVPEDSLVVPARRHGYLAEVDRSALVELALTHVVTVRLQPQRGDYLIPGEPLAWVWPPPPAATVEVLAAGIDAAVSTRYERTLDQDVGFGLRQVVDVAIKAISPAVNDPYTAVQALDRLGLILGRLAEHRLGPQLVHSDGGRLLLAVPSPDFATYLALACDQVRRYGAREPAVVARLLRLLRDLGASVPDEHRPVLHAQVDLVLAAAEAAIDVEHDLRPLRAGAAEARGWIDGCLLPTAEATALEL